MRERAAKALIYRHRALGYKGSILRNDAANTFKLRNIHGIATILKTLRWIQE